MKRKMAVVMLVLMLALALVSLAAAANAKAGVATPHPCAPKVKQFTAEAHYMSLAGDLRLRVHQNTGRWMTPMDAKDCYALKSMYPVYGWRPTDLGPGMVALEELKPFTRGTNYMSVHGYLRWLAMKTSAASA